jgi:RNA polymerase sigma-70 factor (ECF subfamily)
MVSNNNMAPDLAHRIASGDTKAFSAFVQEKARYFHAVAYRITLSKQAAEDVVQSAFTKLWEKRSSIDTSTNGNLSAWLYRIVVNAAIDDRRRLRFVSNKNDFEEIVDAEDVHENMVAKQESEKVKEGLALLQPRQRAAVMMVYYDEMPQKAVAETMGLSLKALESLLSRAKETLKNTILNERVK